MNTHLQISAIVYTLFIALLFFSKRKLNSLDNRTYSVILIYTTISLIIDLLSRLYAITYPITELSEYIFKVNICFLVGYPILFSYYVFCATSEKNIDMIEFNDNPHKSYFNRASKIMYCFMIISWIIVFLLPIELTVKGDYFVQEGLAMTTSFAIGGLCIMSWIIMLIKVRKQIKKIKFIPIYIYTVICTLTVVLQTLIPEICFVSVGIAFMTVLIYHTMDNPDVHLIKQLNIAKAEAEKANNTKTDFLSSMSHEIRTPLNAIVGFGQALAKEDISGTAKEEVQDILMASHTLLDIVNGILDISKIEANKIEIVNGEYNSRKMINEITSLINARIGSKPIDFKILIDENLPDVLYGDSMRVKQIIINLLTNAVKYTQEGRIIFQVRATNEKDNCKLEIQVADTGLGMNDDDIAKLFTKFQRFDMNKNAQVEGTGLGLAITKGLIELMNGEIKVKSKYNQGTTFIVNITQKIIKQKLEKSPIPEETHTHVFNAAGQKVLVVDDNKINLKVAERLLREYNLSIEVAQSGSECIDKILDGKKYDLIFMDIMMPKMSGVETLENLKNIVGFKIPVVALTADVISGMEEKYISKGFDDCLAKPIVEEELYYLLKRFLKESEEVVAPVTTEDLETNEAHNVELLEKNRINVAVGLELLKDMEMYEMTLEEFYNELQNKLTDLENFKNDGNMDDYAILAHGLKSEARYVGCNELGDIAYEHELAGKEKNQELVNQKFDEFKNEINRVYDVLKKYFGE